MKKITLVTDIAFWHSNIGSHMRIQMLARHLAQHCELCVFYLKSVPRDIMEHLKSVGLQNVKVISYKEYSGSGATFNKNIGRLDFFKNRSPDDFVASLKSYIEQNRPDALIFEYIRLAYLLDGCRADIPVLLDMHDVMSARTISLRRAGMTASIEMSASLEKFLLQRFHRVLAISRADVQYLRNMIGLSNVIYVPHSVSPMRTRRFTGAGNRLIFIGANTAPNIAGLSWFIFQAWPLLEQAGYRLDVIGNIKDSFAQFPRGAIFHGQSDELDKHLESADIAINPVFVGGGLKIKCIDALSAGLPCVTTAEGAAGLENAVGRGLFIADSRLNFVKIIKHLANSAVERRLSGVLAQQFIREEFNEAVAYRPILDSIYSSDNHVGSKT